MNITVFSTTHCGTCHMVMQWLDQQGVAYERKVVDQNDSALSEFMAVNDGMISVPLTVIQDGDTVTKVSGFDQRSLEVALT